jgi:hypothetical protein
MIMYNHRLASPTLLQRSIYLSYATPSFLY